MGSRLNAGPRFLLITAGVLLCFSSAALTCAGLGAADDPGFSGAPSFSAALGGVPLTPDGRQGLDLLRAGKDEEAFQKLTAALNAAPQDGGARLALAQLERLRGHSQQ